MYIFASCLVWKWSVKVAVKLWSRERWGSVRYRPSTLPPLPTLLISCCHFYQNTHRLWLLIPTFSWSSKSFLARLKNKTLVATASQGYSTYLLPSSFFLTEYLCVISCSSEATDSLSTSVSTHARYTKSQNLKSVYDLDPSSFWSVSFEFPNLMEVQNWKRRRTLLTQTITFSQTK